jgi:spore maturation protein CgeB
LSYLGTYAPDRQPALNELFIGPARRMPEQRFLLAGAQYPESFPWQGNILFIRHLPPADHPRFLCSSRATLNVTRASMAEYGYCPSGRLFEAAACGVPILSDRWEGLEAFFTPGKEILGVRCGDDVMQALSLSDRELRCVAEAARDRLFAEHTADQRVQALEGAIAAACSERNSGAVAA